MLMWLNRISQVNPKMISEQVLTLQKGVICHQHESPCWLHLQEIPDALGWAAEAAPTRSVSGQPLPYPPNPFQLMPGTGEPGVIRGQ